MIYHFRLRTRLREYARDIIVFSASLDENQAPGSIDRLVEELRDRGDCAVTRKTRADELLTWLRSLPGCSRRSLKVTLDG